MRPALRALRTGDHGEDSPAKAFTDSAHVQVRPAATTTYPDGTRGTEPPSGGAKPSPVLARRLLGTSTRLTGGIPKHVRETRLEETNVTIRVGVNGFGRIGRNSTGPWRPNRPRARPKTSRSWRSTTHRHRNPRPPAEVRLHPGPSADGGRRRRRSHRRRWRTGEGVRGQGRPAACCRGSDAGVDVVVESTGHFNDAKAHGHLESGVKKVIISARPRTRTSPS